jgi:hypothetical protein
MSVKAEHLQDWIGAEVVDPAGESLGKIAEVFFRENDPVVIEIRSGLAGRKHHLASLRDATVSKDRLHLASDVLVEAENGLGEPELERLAAADDRLRGLNPGDLDGTQARDERLRAAAQARAHADELDRAAELRQQEAQQAASAADTAASRAHDAEDQHARARAEAEAARREADELGA